MAFRSWVPLSLAVLPWVLCSEGHVLLCALGEKCTFSSENFELTAPYLASRGEIAAKCGAFGENSWKAKRRGDFPCVLVCVFLSLRSEFFEGNWKRMFLLCVSPCVARFPGGGGDVSLRIWNLLKAKGWRCLPFVSFPFCGWGCLSYRRNVTNPNTFRAKLLIGFWRCPNS